MSSPTQHSVQSYALGLVFAILTTASLTSAQTYTFKDLGPDFVPYAVNAKGTVAGAFHDRPGRWKVGWASPQYLPGATTEGAATGVNDYDQYSCWRIMNGQYRGCYFGSTYSTIQSVKLPSWVLMSGVDAINNTRELVGYMSGYQGDQEHGCYARWLTPQTLPTCVHDSENIGVVPDLTVINQKGKAAGNYDAGLAELGVGFVHPKGATAITFLPRGTVRSMNTLGWEVGAGDPVGEPEMGLGQIWLPNNTTMYLQGECPDGSAAQGTALNGINQAVSAVGLLLCGEETVPVRWDHWNDSWHDLNALTTGLPAGVHLQNAYDIGSKGHIIGITNQGHAFLLTPVSTLLAAE